MNPHFSCLDTNPIEDLLRLIERKAPQFMRAGGLVGLTKPNGSGCRATAAEFQRARELLTEGYSPAKIARVMNRCEDWVRRCTLDLRAGKKRYGRTK